MNKALNKYRKTPYRSTRYGKRARTKRLIAMMQACMIAATAKARMQSIRTMKVDASSITEFGKRCAIAKTAIDSMGAIKSALTIK